MNLITLDIQLYPANWLLLKYDTLDLLALYAHACHNVVCRIFNLVPSASSLSKKIGKKGRCHPVLEGKKRWDRVCRILSAILCVRILMALLGQYNEDMTNYDTYRPREYFEIPTCQV